MLLDSVIYNRKIFILLTVFFATYYNVLSFQTFGKHLAAIFRGNRMG